MKIETFSVIQGRKDSVQLKESNVALAWTNLGLEVTDWSGFKVKKKPILRRLTGSCRVGTLNGLLGPSGAGKTSLLNVLSGTNTFGLSGGSLIYSKEKNPTSYFIQQHVHESIVGELTVGQILRYAYQFKNGLTKSEAIEKFIWKTLQDLLLDSSILDRPFSLCSGGEQKRVAIAQELMSTRLPTFIFLDEPTTGLDSAAALEVMTSLQTLARTQGITIIASIHAPNDETLHLFDQLYVLAKGGVCIFSGAPSSIRSFLESESQQQFSKQQPPIEVLIKLACEGMTHPFVAKLAHFTLNSFPTDLSSLTLLPVGLPNPRKSFTLSDLLLQLFRLFRITFIAKRTSLFLSLLLFTFYMLILCSMFNSSMTVPNACAPLNQTAPETAQTCLDTIENFNLLRENCFFHCNVLIYIGVITISSAAALFSTTIKVFRSEHGNGWYSLGVFFVSSTAVYLLQVFLYALLNGTLAYFLSFQHSADDYHLNWNRLGHYIFFVGLLCFYMQSIGQLVGVLFIDHLDMAIIVSVVYYICASTINGFFVDTEKKGNVFLQEGSSLLAFKFISWGMIYTFYGLERCDWEKEYSTVLLAFHINVDHIGVYVWRVLMNILAVRLITLLIMFAKFEKVNYLKLSKPLKQHTTESKLKIELPVVVAYENSSFHCQPETSLKVQTSHSSSKAYARVQNQTILAWRNLSLYGGTLMFDNGYKNPANVKSILQNLNGEFKFGTLNALMGTSGAGKTSLLKVLNGRCKSRLSDETTFYLSKHTHITTCFITQQVSGHLMAGLTAKQMLTYASRLKNAQMKNFDHEWIAKKWLQELDLMSAENTKVECCSGGEQKRLAVALELTALSMPNCVCIDEPTSGLDSNSAEIVMSVLHKLTRHHPMTIITSIHQPTSEILAQFDQLYVLARGGVAIYSGPPTGITAHLTAISQPPTHYPIESLVQHSCGTPSHPTVQALVTLTNAQWTPSKEATLSRQTQPIPDGITRNRTRFSLSSVITLFSRYSLNFSQHLWKENVAFSLIYILYGLIVPFFYEETIYQASGCIDIQSDINTFCSANQTALAETFQLMENFKYTFFVNNFFLVFLLLQFALSLLKDLPLFENEHRNGCFSSGAFYLAKSLFQLTPLLPSIALYVYIISEAYEAVVPSPDFYWHLLLLFTLSIVAFQGMAHCIAILSRGSTILLTILIINFFCITVILSNFLLLYSRLHYVYQFLSNFAAGRFLFEGVMLLQYGFGRCPPGELQFTLYSMELSDSDYSRCLWMLLFNIVFYRIIAVFLLLSNANPRENRRRRGARIEEFRKNLKATSRAAVPGFAVIQELRIKC